MTNINKLIENERFNKPNPLNPFKNFIIPFRLQHPEYIKSIYEIAFSRTAKNPDYKRSFNFSKGLLEFYFNKLSDEELEKLNDLL